MCMSIIFQKQTVRKTLIGATAAGLVFGGPFAHAKCNDAIPEPNRCADFNEAPGGLAPMLATSTGTGSLSGSFVISNQITSEEHEVLPPEYANFRKYQAVRGKLVTGRVTNLYNERPAWLEFG